MFPQPAEKPLASPQRLEEILQGLEILVKQRIDKRLSGMVIFRRSLPHEVVMGKNFSEQIKESALVGPRYVLIRKMPEGARDVIYTGDDKDDMESCIRFRRGLALGDGAEFFIVDLDATEKQGAEIDSVIEYLEKEGVLNARKDQTEARESKSDDSGEEGP